MSATLKEAIDELCRLSYQQAATHDVALGKAVLTKMKYNLTRGYRHGKTI
jgi:hypothetical protein